MGSALPLAAMGGTAWSLAAPRTSRAVTGPRRISPGLAACSRRAAVLTVSPVASVSPRDGSPATTSPVLRPTRRLNSRPRRGASSSLRIASSSSSSAAALAARSASSSWSVGRPKIAMTASPTNFSTVPPWRSIVPRIAANACPTADRTTSASAASPSAVEPTMSAKRTVTVRRDSLSAARCSASRLPQL